MKAIPRKGSWRKSSPGVYVKNIGTYGSVKFGATARVSFVPFPTCEILDANYVSVGVPTPADEKKFIAAAKKVYTKDTKTEAERAQKRATARTAPAQRTPTTSSATKAKATQSGEALVKKLTKAQELEAEIGTLRGKLSALGRAPSTATPAYKAYMRKKSSLSKAIQARQAAIRKLLPAKYRTPRQFAAAIQKTHEEETSVLHVPYTPGYAERRDRTYRAIAREYE